MRKIPFVIAGILLACLFAGAVSMSFPGIRERVMFKYDELRVRLRYAINPPQEAVFVPNSQVDAIVQATMLSLFTTQTAAAVTPTPPVPTITVEISPTPTLTPTPLPAEVAISGVRYQTQHGLWNYCAPSTLAMALSYWGWEGTRTDVGPVLKPFDKDKNVMPYEMVDYIETYAGLKAVLRYGGTLDLLKRLVAGGFPVLLEKGIVIRDYNGRLGWMGHYTVVSGYQDASREFITQDSYFSEDFIVSYDELQQQWRSFNYTFIVIYSADKEDQLMSVLGEYSDQEQSSQIAARIAAEEAVSLSGVQQFFAYFNRGSSLVNLQDYAGAASTYDQAFTLMAALPAADRPWRVMWYQTGPYFAYYYTGRYQDIIQLASNTIDTVDEPYIEESFIWRARALIALGDNQAAMEDVRKALEYHPGYAPAVELAQYLGIQP
jgi:tetratricopeptide (TPR) repeat protein